MNKKAFTLVELLAVMVLLALVMIIIVPTLSTLLSSHKNEEYETYLDMMVEYTKVYPNYTSRQYICLSELNLKPINNNINCSGYVTINQTNHKITPFLSCKKNNELTYQSNNYSKPSGC